MHPDIRFITGSTPTVLLLHGAFADASSWAGVIAQLHAAGIDVLAPALSLRALSEDAAYVASVARRVDGPVLLVGHSYGGAVATVAGTQAHNVVGLVYVAAFALDEGESVAQLVADYARPGFAAALRPAEFTTNNGDVAIEVALSSEPFRAVFAADLDGETAAVMAVTQRPVAAAALEEKAPAPAWKALPAWYIVATADQALHPDAQRFLARRAAAHIVEVEGSHAIPLSRPTPVAAHIRSAAESTCGHQAR